MMVPRPHPFFPLLLACVLATGCDPGAGAAPIPTADPEARGYTDADFPRVQELAPAVYSYEQLRSAGEERFTTVSLFVVTVEGVLVADGQGSVEETRRLVETIAGITDRPITHVVIGSDHGDHTGGNAAFPQDALFMAHPTSAAILRAAAAEGSGARVPIVEVRDRIGLRLGDKEVEVRFLGRAHTGGDLVVHLPKDGIVFMSEAYLHRIFPAMRTAFPSEWIGMVEAAQALDATTYVPGHGFVDDPETLRRELEIFRRALMTVVEEGRRLHEAGLSLEEAQAQADFGDLESWSLRSSQGPRALQQVYAELDGALPTPDEGPGR
jgi:glyoxylase-like metal-dependent hydrolase (beta-lactamase superfamily II)